MHTYRYVYTPPSPSPIEMPVLDYARPKVKKSPLTNVNAIKKSRNISLIRKALKAQKHKTKK